MCIQSMSCDIPHKKSNEVRSSDYLCCISFLNMYWAFWRNSCIGAQPVYLCSKWTPIITWANWIEPFMTVDIYLTIVDAYATSNDWYIRAQTPSYLVWIMTEATIRTKWYLFSKSNLSLLNKVYITRKLIIFVYSTSNCRLSVLNINTNHESLQEHWLWWNHLLLWGNHLLIWRATSDIRTYDFDNVLNFAENGLQISLSPTQEMWRSICGKWELKTWPAACDEIQVL